MQKLFLIILLLTAVLYSQQRGNRPGGTRKFRQLHATVQIIPKSSSEISVSYLYRIPYNQVIFEKDGDSFKASVRVLVELMKDEELVERNFEDKKVTVNDFDITQSKSVAIEGVINFELEAAEYFVKGVVTDLNSNKEIKLAPVNINGMSYIDSGIFKPVIINFAESNCNGKNLPLIVNQGGSIPFSSQDYQLVIPIADTTVEQITIEMRNNDEEPFTQTLTESYITKLSVVECEDKFFIGQGDNVLITKNFILRNFSRNLQEGILITTVRLNKDGEEHDFPIRVVWLNKPISLRNPEFAIEILKYIEEEEIVSKLLDEDEDDYQKALHNFWKQYDPTPETEYNELMEEYYSRIDYAALEFRGISKQNGLSTDRGKIYIQHGKPDKIERASDLRGYVVETWIYDSLNQNFVFIDKQGTGNFILIDG
jgi:GWxTD domain-containing protein